MPRRSLLALAAVVLLFAAACSDDGAGTDAAPGDGTEVDQSAGDAATGDAGTADTTVESGSKSTAFCEQVAERPLTNDPGDAAEHYAKLQGVAPKHLQDGTVLLEKAYRELADNGEKASDIDDEGAIETAIADLVQYQKDICFG